MKYFLKNDEGFTLVEALVSLTVSTFVLLLLMTGIQQAFLLKANLVGNSSSYTSNNIVSNRQVEWHIFLNQLENYLRGSKNPQVVSRMILVEEWDEDEQEWFNVTYEPPESNISRISRFKKNGNMIMLTGVSHRTFKKEGGWLLIEVKFQNNEVFNGRVWVESWVR